jgi:hypothetical protein
MPPDEGYVKFACAHEPGPPPGHPRLRELMRIRDDLRTWGLVGVLPDGVGYGNASARIAGTPRFVVTASGTGAAFPIQPSHFSEVLAIDVDQNRVACRGPLPASSESMSHGAIYAARPDAHAVLHVHDPAAFRMLWSEGAPRTPADAAFGTPELARAVGRLAAALPPAALLVMAGHEDGLLAFAPTLHAACDAVWSAYSRARMQ